MMTKWISPALAIVIALILAAMLSGCASVGPPATERFVGDILAADRLIESGDLEGGALLLAEVDETYYAGGPGSRDVPAMVAAARATAALEAGLKPEFLDACHSLVNHLGRRQREAPIATRTLLLIAHRWDASIPMPSTHGIPPRVIQLINPPPTGGKAR